MPKAPRIEYDEDDDGRDGHGSPPTPGWRRRLLTWGLAAVGLGLGFLIPYTIYLNHQVGERFGQLRWQLPTRVYARPLVLRAGTAMDAQTLKTELEAAGYRDDGAGVRPGTYSRDGGRWLIASRGFFDVDGQVAPRRIDVVLSGSRVASVRDARAQAIGEGRAPGSGAHRHALRPAAGRAPHRAHRGSARAARHRPAGGRGSRLQPPPRHRPVRHRARGVGEPALGRSPAGREHDHPAARAQRPARHRQGTDLHPQVQRSPLCAADRSALRQEDDPRGLLQPGVPGPAGFAGDPRRGRGVGILVRPRPAGSVDRTGRAADRHGARPVALRSAPQSGAREGTPQLRARQDARIRADQRRRIRACEGRAARRDEDAGQHRQSFPGVCRPRAPPARARLSRRRAAGRGPDACSARCRRPRRRMPKAR